MNDTMCSTPLGPVPAKLYSLIRDYHATKGYQSLDLYDRDQAMWNEYFKTRGYNVIIAKQDLSGLGISLDEEEREALAIAAEGFGALTWNELVDYTHRYISEWRNPHGSSVRIPENAIIDAFV